MKRSSSAFLASSSATSARYCASLDAGARERLADRARGEVLDEGAHREQERAHAPHEQRVRLRHPGIGAGATGQHAAGDHRRHGDGEGPAPAEQHAGDHDRQAVAQRVGRARTPPPARREDREEGEEGHHLQRAGEREPPLAQQEQQEHVRRLAGRGLGERAARAVGRRRPRSAARTAPAPRRAPTG